MANQEQVTILLSGVENWSRWREENPAVIPDLSGADLSGADLWKADLWEADLSGADLSEADLSGADLSEADLSEADLWGVRGLRQADFEAWVSKLKESIQFAD